MRGTAEGMENMADAVTHAVLWAQILPAMSCPDENPSGKWEGEQQLGYGQELVPPALLTRACQQCEAVLWLHWGLESYFVSKQAAPYPK